MDGALKKGVGLLVILFLSGVIWVGSHQLDPYRPIASKVSGRACLSALRFSAAR